MKEEYTDTIVELFYLVIIADGEVDPKELEMGRSMARIEGLDSTEFENGVAKLIKDGREVYADCVSGLKKLTQDSQVKFLAWMCLIANADGFMHNKEWDIIYKLYHKELKLDRQSILDHQFKLNQKLRGYQF
ncbi:MAG: hypothetical protein AAF693_04205 [Bacteroidota bacterium]